MIQPELAAIYSKCHWCPGLTLTMPVCPDCRALLRNGPPPPRTGWLTLNGSLFKFGDAVRNIGAAPMVAQ